MAEEKNDHLRPRFSIHKQRIGDDKNAKSSSEEVDFVPDKVIYVELDEEITTVFDRIKRERGKHLALVVPKRAVLLSSIVNLRILKKKVDELEKEIAIVTSDVPGLQLAEKVGVATAEKLFKKDPTKVGPTTPPMLHGERPERIANKKLSISEVIRQEKSDVLTTILSRVKERIKRKKQQAERTRIVFITPNKQALFTLILVSVLLLLAIAYIALPGATIYITPRSSILDPTFNITFLDYSKNRDVLDSGSSTTITIPSYPVRPPPLIKKFTYNSTGKEFKGANAHGMVTITNTSPTPWDLSSKTRFQTSDGLIFRIQSSVRVPGANLHGYGTLDTEVVADAFDVQGQVIGSRGNIPPTKFFLPGLKTDESRKKLYAESKAPMVGGLSNTIKTVSKDDLAAAREKIKKEVSKTATDDLKKYLEDKNISEKTNYSLLTDRHTITVSEPTITIPDNLEGKETDQFEVTVTYSLAGVAYDRQELKRDIKDRIVNRVDPDKKIIKINEDDISYRYLDQNDDAGKIRLTATMRAIQMYELNPSQGNGQRFIKKITDHILGMRVADAQDYLMQQTDEIAQVDIKTWPLWAPTIPNIADNVKFVIQDEGFAEASKNGIIKQ